MAAILPPDCSVHCARQGRRNQNDGGVRPPRERKSPGTPERNGSSTFQWTENSLFGDVPHSDVCRRNCARNGGNGQCTVVLSPVLSWVQCLVPTAPRHCTTNATSLDRSRPHTTTQQSTHTTRVSKLSLTVSSLFSTLMNPSHLQRTRVPIQVSLPSTTTPHKSPRLSHLHTSRTTKPILHTNSHLPSQHFIEHKYIRIHSTHE